MWGASMYPARKFEIAETPPDSSKPNDLGPLRTNPQNAPLSVFFFNLAESQNLSDAPDSGGTVAPFFLTISRW